MRSSFITNLAISSVSAILAVAILACSAHALSTFNTQQQSDVWLLPIWRNHFDIRDLQLAVATSAVITVLNLAYLLSTILLRVPSTAVKTTIATLGASIALVAVIFPAVVNNQKSAYVDTLRTWTCGWNSMNLSSDAGPPSSFATMCTESRFAFYAIIPVFILQLCLLASSIYEPVVDRRRAQAFGAGVEKGHSMDSYQRQGSWDISRNSPKAHTVETIRPVAA